MAGLYVIAKQLFDHETGLIAALFYSVFQPWASFKNLAFNGEMVMNLAIVWAWAIGFRPEFIEMATRAVGGRRAPLRGFPAQAAGRDSGNSARDLFSAS